MNGISSKVGIGGAAGAVTIVLVWAVGLIGLVIPPEVASAITVLITVGVGFWVPETATVDVTEASVKQVVTPSPEAAPEHTIY